MTTSPYSSSGNWFWQAPQCIGITPDLSEFYWESLKNYHFNHLFAKNFPKPAACRSFALPNLSDSLLKWIYQIIRRLNLILIMNHTLSGYFSREPLKSVLPVLLDSLRFIRKFCKELHIWNYSPYPVEFNCSVKSEIGLAAKILCRTHPLKRFNGYSDRERAV